MEIIKYSNDLHFEIILEWLSCRDINYRPTQDEMPAIGYIAYKEHQPIAAAFLRRVEGGFGQLDGLITNPEALPALRHSAIDTIVEEILNTAKQLGIKTLTATTKDKNTLVRSSNHGFVEVPQTLIAVDLRNRDRKI